MGRFCETKGIYFPLEEIASSDDVSSSAPFQKVDMESLLSEVLRQVIRIEKKVNRPFSPLLAFRLISR